MTVIDQIKSKVELVAHIQQYIELQQKGKNWIAVCPFHDDHNPSLSVSQEKGLFKCFSCGVGGDIIKFEMLWKKCSWKTAINNLNQQYQLQLELKWDKTNFESPETKQMKQLLLDAHKWFQLHLSQAQNNNELKAFLKKREINENIIKQWKLGWADANWEIREFLRSKSYEDGVIFTSGLVNVFEKKIVNFFQNRLIFPIYNADQVLVGFVGREINNDNLKGLKYLSFPTTKLFQKNKLLFNFNYPDIDVNFRDQTVYLVEGILDAIRLQTQNINAIALMGTNLGSEQVNLIKSSYKKVVIWLDGDRAGWVATIKAAKMLLLKNIEVRIVDSDKNTDPDSWILQNPDQPVPNGKPPLVWLFEQTIEWTVEMKRTIAEYLKIFWINSDLKIQEGAKSQITKIYGPNWLESMVSINNQNQILFESEQQTFEKTTALIPEEVWIWILFFYYKKLYDIFCTNKWEFKSQLLQNSVNLIEKWYNISEKNTSVNLKLFLEKESLSNNIEYFLNLFWNDSKIREKSEKADFINVAFNKFHQLKNEKKIKRLIKKDNLLGSEIKQIAVTWKKRPINYVDQNWRNNLRKT